MRSPNNLIEFLEIRTNCACGCGLEATQVYKGVPIPEVNPMQHYRRYMSKTYTNRNLLDARGERNG